MITLLKVRLFACIVLISTVCLGGDYDAGTYNFTYEGGPLSIISPGDSWRLDLLTPGADVDWISGSKETYNITRNSSVYERNGIVKILYNAYGGNGNGYLYKTYVYTVVQEGAPVDVSVSATDFGVGGCEGTCSVASQNDAEWHIDAIWDYGESSQWITFSKTNGVGCSEFQYSVMPNPLGRQRIATVIIASKKYTFCQAGNLEYEGSEGQPTSPININSWSYNGLPAITYIDDVEISGSDKLVQYTWQPLTTGYHTLSVAAGTNSWAKEFYVSSLSFQQPKLPSPPMSKDGNISITPTIGNFDVFGGKLAINTSGSGTWTAATSDPWITLTETSGNAGTAVGYTVTASTNIGQRVGYVYVSGHVYTVAQDGYEATVSPTEIAAEKDGKTGEISIDTPGRFAWDARPNVDWLSVSPTHGVGSGSVTYQVAPYNAVSTREGTLTVGDKTVTVFQYGRRMKLSSYKEACDYFAHPIPVVVEALAITSWHVSENASWIQLLNEGKRDCTGSATLSFSVAENPSWKARTGTVTIGAETLTITQEGRTELEFSVTPPTATAHVSGGNGYLAVTATPDLPWTVQSESSWVTIFNGSKSGSGNGNVAFVASPNNTLADRIGRITIIPGDSSLSARTVIVQQAAATASISRTAYVYEASGGAVSVDVTVNDIVEWSVVENLDWIGVNGSSSRTGPGSVTITALANNTIYPRSGTLTIAGKTFTVSQKGRGVEIEYDNKRFETKGGWESISVNPDGNGSWQPVASDPEWILLEWNTVTNGPAEVSYIVAPYIGDGTPRVGTITIGDKTVYITQSPYELDITPRAETVTGNAGEGEIGISASIGDVWQAIITEPSWIKIVTGYDAGTGSGTVRFTYTENNTGVTRTGKIIISGEAYTLTQNARIAVDISATAEGGGSVSGAGSYTLGEQATLTAIPNSGYEFLYWTGSAGETLQNPLRVTADVAKSFTAHFGPLTPEFTEIESSTEGVTLSWSALAWATQYKIYRAPTSEFPTVSLVTLQASAGGTYKDTTGEVGQSYFYWVEAIGADDTTECKDAASGMKKKPIVYSDITYTNLKGATHSNPATYQEGTLVSFTAPSAVAGYTFTGWTPSAITATMTGAQAVQANWKANSYTIAYDANGGTGTMEGGTAEYDQDATVASNVFVYANHEFMGWATSADGPVVYAPGTTVRNLSSIQNGVVMLYAVWELAELAEPIITPADGATFDTATQTVTITCPTEGAAIYFTTNGVTPKTTASYRYTGVFTIGGTTTVKAIAVYTKANGETLKSGYVTATISSVEPQPPADPVITPADGAEFVGDSCTVTIACASEGATVYYSTTGSTPKTTDAYKYTAPFTITGTTTVKAVAVKNGLKSAYVTAVITKKTVTLADAVGAGALTFTTGGDAVWTIKTDASAKMDGMCVQSGEIADSQTTWIETTLSGAGTLSFWWKANCEDDPDGATWDHIAYSVDGVEKAFLDGVTGWTQVSVPLSEGAHTVRWTYSKDDSDAEGEDCAYLDAVVWTPSGPQVIVATDPNGTITVPTSGEFTVKVMKNGHDITAYLDLPAVVGGVINLADATVKAAIVAEPLDTTKGAVVDLVSDSQGTASPTLKTAPTRPGLTYTLREGATLGGMSDGDSKVGDGQPWTPNITVKGGTSGFYSIKVSK